MVEAVQPCVLEQITNAVRSMTTNVGGKPHGAKPAERRSHLIGRLPSVEQMMDGT